MRLFGVTAGQFLRIGLIALVFIILAKYLTQKVNVPGLSSLIAGA